MRCTRALLQQVAGSASTSRKYFSPQNHAWYRVALSMGTGNNKPATCSVQVGLTRHGLDHIGDITNIIRQSSRNSVKAGEGVLKIEWEGFTRTECDELYHAAWESIEGEHIISSPIAGTISDAAVDADVEIDEDTVLVVVDCEKPEEIEERVSNDEWLEVDQYEAWVRQQEPGKFAEAS